MAKYDKQYIERVTKQYWEIINDTAEYDDWTQICISIQDAVKAAASVWPCNTDKQKVEMGRFLNELIINGELKNLSQFEITFKKKEIVI